jgi:hypothetical protein
MSPFRNGKLLFGLPVTQKATQKAESVSRYRALMILRERHPDEHEVICDIERAKVGLPPRRKRPPAGQYPDGPRPRYES